MKTNTTKHTMCMFCGGIDRKHKNDEVCRIKGVVVGALMASMKPFEAMMIADRTPFLKELERRLGI
ncbi:MAG: hypothetical protein UMS36scaffold28_58 [Phage 59_13]|nr:MAG: hypothetical protein UMS36scaffold28_58 [Phage 59_13]